MEANFSEVSIAVPWGHIAGRWYGSQDERPILALHGWLDNCGTFTKLAPLLAPHHSLLCIDYPGHGRSSHLPPGVMYHTMEFVRIIGRIMQAYKWKKVSLMGHSMGASVAFKFASLYPERVDMVISLDALKSFYWTPSLLVPFFEHLTEMAIKDNERLMSPYPSQPASFSFKQLEYLIHEGSMKSIDLDKCKYILERNVANSKLYPHKYYFSRDQRARNIIQLNATMEMALEMAKRICRTSMPYIVIKGGESDNSNACATELDDFMMRHNTNFEQHVYAQGTHHMHLNNAPPVAEIIIEFLHKHKGCNMTSSKM
ncbi:serine hydrolase-like protein [Stomoxys calcitrans]|uniref:AB hydrolase-1 domain-containing protein n=1 Tax=Stomoxys calcitrans TaxID=35570 RepID=A0A1I8PV51_STOCA|nr:serine hydrolase-like protein [Stomoxys calcitrans]XP_013107031.1 serine hydrolase-like protein [Stomoxys calcitrans]